MAVSALPVTIERALHAALAAAGAWQDLARFAPRATCDGPGRADGVHGVGGPGDGRWRSSGEEWLLIADGRVVARLVPNADPTFPQYRWLSLLADEYAQEIWHGVDFETLDAAMSDI